MTTSSVQQADTRERIRSVKWTAATLAALALWVGLYSQLIPLSE